MVINIKNVNKIPHILLITAILLYTILLTASVKEKPPDDIYPLLEIESMCTYKLGDSPLDDRGIPIWSSGNPDIEWSEFKFPGKPKNINKSRFIWIKVSLPQNAWDNPYLFFRFFQQNIEVYYDKEVIYWYGSMDSKEKIHAPGSTNHFVRLDKEYLGDSIFIRLYSPFADYTGYLQEMKIGNQRDIIIDLIRHNSDGAVLAVLIVFIGIILCILYLVKNKSREFLYMGGASTCLGLWILAESKIVQFYIDIPHLWMYTAFLCIYLMPVGFCMFCKVLFACSAFYKKLLKIMAITFIIFTVFSFTLELLGILSLLVTMKAFHVMLIICMIAIIASIIKSAFGGNREAVVFSWGIIILCIFGLYDIISMFYLNVPLAKIKLTHWGMFAVILSLLFIVIKRYSNMYKGLKQDSKLNKIALEKSEEKYKMLVETVQEGIGILDENDRISYCNPMFCKILALPKDMVQNKSVFSFFDKINRHNLVLHSKVKKGKSFQKYELEINTKNGIKHISVSESRMSGENSEYLGAVITVSDISKHKETEEKIRNRAYNDSLTGIKNRAFFEEEIIRMQNSLKSFKPVSIVCIDVDGLKIINDTFGHATGDELLSNAAELLTQIFINGDVVARVGGDEFCIILPNTDFNKAKWKCESLSELVKKHNSGKPFIPISISIGYSEFDENEDDSLYDTYKRADNSMYEYKLNNTESYKIRVTEILMSALSHRCDISEERTKRLENHIERIADELNMSEQIKNSLVMLSRLRDIGKIGLPQEMYRDNKRLSEEEKELEKEHVIHGYNMANRCRELSSIAKLIKCHHECWDGSGYPLGLKREKIPYECRVLSVLDFYDEIACSSQFSNDCIIKQLNANAGRKLDPNISEKLIEIINK